MKNKISYISYASIPSESANSVHIMKMCEALGKICKVKLLSPYKKETSSSNSVYEYYGVERSFEISRGNFSHLNSPWRPFFYSLLSVLKSKFFSWQVLTRSPIVAMFCVLLQVRCILELHDTLESTSILVERVYAKLPIFSSRHIVKVIVITDALKRYYSEKYGIGDKTIILHDAVNLNLSKNDINSQIKLKLKNGFDKHIGYVGSFAEGKGADTVVKIANKNPNNMFHLFGGDKTDIQQVREDLQGNNVEFYGHVPNKLVPGILINMDILLMPYKEKVRARGGASEIGQWMSPMKMFEYMASGKPIISSDLPVLREVLEDKKNSLLVEAENIDSWVNAIERLSKDMALANKISKSAFGQVSMFTWELRAQKILEAY